MKHLQWMSEEEITTYFRKLGHQVEALLPPGPSTRGKCLFFLMVTDSVEPGRAQYLANIRRDDAIVALRELADRLERHEDTPR